MRNGDSANSFLVSTILLFFPTFVTSKSLLVTEEGKEPVGANTSGNWLPALSPQVSMAATSLVSGIASLVMMFGGVVPYIPQYRAIEQTQNAEGFSTYVCLALLLANILRITFWFGKPFELPLLAQSFIMIAAMLVMLQKVISVRIRTASQGATRKHFREFKPDTFWQWTDFQSYIEFLACFSSLCAALLFLFGGSSTFVEVIGFLAVFTEAMLGVPQFFRNFRSRSTAGMSVAMVAMWTSGDLFKTVYFISRDAPIQFAICGILQVAIDIAILLQVFFYGSGGGNRSFRPLVST